MKSRIIAALSSTLLVPVFAFAPVLADDNASSTPSSSSSSQTSTTEDKGKLQARLQERKTNLKTKLTTTEEKRIQSRCKSSQGLVKSLQAKINGTETSRTQVYGNLVTHLTTLQGKLDSKGADTAELKTEVTTLQAKITTFNTDLATYKQSVSDLVDMDCAADATGFKASLTEARTDLKKVQDDSAAVKSYVKDTIRPTLVKIRASLDTSATKTENN